MIHGACNCGAVRYEVDADTRDVYVCHCSICRRFTGSAGIAVLVVDRAAFRWVSGQDGITHWRKPGSAWESWFCRTCGSAVPGTNTETTMFIPAGSVSSSDAELRVAHHIYVASKAGWDVIGDTGQQHPEAIAR